MNEERTYPANQNVKHFQQLGERLRPSSDLEAYVRQYVREKPEAAALWCFGIGFVLGWKLKPW